MKTFASARNLHRHACKRSTCYTCCKCAKSFGRRDTLRRHELAAHADGAAEKKWPCGKCGRPFARQEHCARHAATCDGGKSGHIKCARCPNVAFRTHRDFLRHERSAHAFDGVVEKRHFASNAAFEDFKKEQVSTLRRACAAISDRSARRRRSVMGMCDAERTAQHRTSLPDGTRATANQCTQ